MSWDDTNAGDGFIIQELKDKVASLTDELNKKKAVIIALHHELSKARKK